MQGFRRISAAAFVAAACTYVASGLGQTGAAAPGGTAGPTPALDSPQTAQMIADQFVDQAFFYTSDASTPPAAAALRASLLLELADRVKPGDPRILKLLAEAAGAAGRTDPQRAALRDLIKADPGDLVAQVQYLDFLAASTEALDERAKVYQRAFDTAALDPQIRSEMALRLARIVAERGDTEGARTLLRQALQLNSVNVGALREWIRLAGAKPEEQVQALAALLAANPYQPDAWLSLARLLEAAEMHSQAADALTTAIEQTQKDGGNVAADLIEELSMELAIAGRRAEALPMLTELAKMPDAHLSALVTARLVGNAYGRSADKARLAQPAPATTPAPATAPATGPASAPATQRAASGPAPRAPGTGIDMFAPRALPAANSTGPDQGPAALDTSAAIRKQLGETTRTNDPGALAAAAWIELAVMPEPSADVDGWITTLTGLAKTDEQRHTVDRLAGWQLLRKGKLDAALARLKPVADADPLAQLGVARALTEQGKTAQAAAALQDLWGQYPTGILALQVADEARTAGVTLEPTSQAARYTGALQSIPATFWTTHRQVRNLELVMPDDLHSRYEVGDPMLLHLSISNVSGHPLSVGPDGAIKTTIGIAGAVRNAPPLGMFAVENLQRTYRLEAGAAIDAQLRIDQRQLAAIFTQNPITPIEVSISLLTAPRGDPANPHFGLGGQVVTVQPPGITRVGVNLTAENSRTELPALIKQLTDAPPRERFVAIAVCCSLLAELGPVNPDASARPEVARKMICDALLPLLKSPSALVRTWTLRYLPATGLTPDLDAAVQALADDSSPLVRASWVTNEVVLGMRDSRGVGPARQILIDRAKAETDPVVKAWTETILHELDVQPPPQTRPATRPAATSPG